MPSSETPTCEVKVEGAWQRMPVIEVHRHHRDALKRCPACHGQVRTVGHHLRTRWAKMLHLHGHEGCPLIPRQYCGMPYPHPDAIG